MKDATALRRFEARKVAHVGKQIYDATLPAGSPMHYYCRFCGAPTETLPELHNRHPKTICRPCKLLRERGLIK